MEILIQASQLILSLSILIVLHELGHFIPARLFKTRVEKFYLFFDPWFSLFKKKVGDTEYGIGWLPLGGYVKISGMIDESMDKEQMKKPPEEWEFRAKPAWQRLIIMIGGVPVNLILGILIYAMVLFVWGDKYLPNKNVEHGVVCSDIAKGLGFKDGDKIVSIDGENIDRFDNITSEMITRDESFVVVVKRGGVSQNIIIGENLVKHFKNHVKNIPRNERFLFSVRKKVLVDSVLSGSNAENSGLLSNDRVVSINGLDSEYFDQLNKLLLENKGKVVSLGVLRGGIERTVDCLVDTNGKIGFSLSNNDLVFEKESFSFLSSIPAGYNKAIEKLSFYIDQFALIFNSKNDLMGEIGGFGAIGSMFSVEWNWQHFWSWTAFLSLILAFMNLLPIPALDGGHVMFLLYEIVVGKPVPEKVMEYAQIVGMVLLLTLFVWANANDVIRFLN